MVEWGTLTARNIEFPVTMNGRRQLPSQYLMVSINERLN